MRGTGAEGCSVLQRYWRRRKILLPALTLEQRTTHFCGSCSRLSRKPRRPAAALERSLTVACEASREVSKRSLNFGGLMRASWGRLGGKISVRRNQNQAVSQVISTLILNFGVNPQLEISIT